MNIAIFLKDLFSRPDSLILWTVIVLNWLFLGLFVCKWLQFHRARVSIDELIDGVKNELKRNFSEAIAFCDNTPGPVARVLLSALFVYPDKTDTQPDVRKVLNDIRNMMQKQIDIEIWRLESWMRFFPALAVIAPLLGWVNLVLGFINAKMDSASWNEAIQQSVYSWSIPLVIGVVLSILCSLAYYCFKRRIDEYCDAMRSATREIMDFTRKRYSTDGERETIELNLPQVNSHLQPMGPWNRIFAVCFLLLIVALIYSSGDTVRVQGVLVTEIEPKTKIAWKKSIIEVKGKNDFVYNDEKIKKEDLDEKIAKISDENIYFLVNSDGLEAQDFIDLMDLAGRFKKHAFIIVKPKAKTPVAVGTAGQE